MVALQLIKAEDFDTFFDLITYHVKKNHLIIICYVKKKRPSASKIILIWLNKIW
jgi:hypothetical protein